jgi:hypothetical protein
MKNLFTLIILCTLGLLFSVKAQAQVQVGVSVSCNKLRVFYHPLQAYKFAPINRWSAQVITIRYPNTVEVNWSNLVNLTNFPFEEDPLTSTPIDGGNGYYYKVFRTPDVPVVVNMSGNTSFNVFEIDIDANEYVPFEISPSTPWTTANNANVSVMAYYQFQNGPISFLERYGGQFLTGDAAFITAGPTAIINPFQGTVSAGPIYFRITFSEPVSDFTASDVVVEGGGIASVQPAFLPENFKVYNIVVTASYAATITVKIPAGSVVGSCGKLNTATNSASTYFDGPPPPEPCPATYFLEELNDGYYQVSLIPGKNWSGTDAITATAQVTVMVNTSTSAIDSFNITDLQMLTGATWAQNSRYNAPAESPEFDYISFGLTSYGTTDIPYVVGQAVPLFKWKNTGICSDDYVYLMPVTDDPFAYPNSLNANVGQQLSVSGYNEPDVPICVDGYATCISEVVFDFRALLQGPYVPAEGVMHDSLRVLGLIPEIEPYTNYQPIRGSSFSPFQHYEDGGGETVDFSAPYADTVPVVDWVLIELRSQYDPYSIVSTRSAMVLRNGTIRDLNYGNFLLFKKLRSDKYFFTIRHRNHLALMSENPVPLVNTVNSYDFSDPATPMYDLSPDLPQDDILNKSSLDGLHAGYLLGNKRLMWAGNSNADDYIMFQGGGVGEGLDIDNVFDNIFTDPDNLNFSYNHVRDGYYPGDNNLDGRVKYQGPANDVDQYIFFNIISRHPGNTQKYINYYITQQLPK